MPTRQNRWLAIRKLSDSADPQAIVKAQIGAPEKLRDDEWRCQFRIVGLDKGKAHFAHGVDAFQSLINAIESIARIIRESGRQLTWIGGEPGDPGFHRQVPTYLGPEFALRIETMIDREVQDKVNQLESNARSKARSSGNVS